MKSMHIAHVHIWMQNADFACLVFLVLTMVFVLVHLQCTLYFVLVLELASSRWYDACDRPQGSLVSLVDICAQALRPLTRLSLKTFSVFLHFFTLLKRAILHELHGMIIGTICNP